MNPGVRAASLALLVLGAPACGSAPRARGAGAGVAPPTTARPLPVAVWYLDAFDVGTGLSMLLRGSDFTLLYDGGSNDDRAVGRDSRLLAYLDRALGPSGPARCRVASSNAGDLPERTLSHVFLSHPHRDHVGLLPDVLDCYAVRDVWDSGAPSDTQIYRTFLAAVAGEPGVTYHAARPPPAGGRLADGQGAGAPWIAFHEGDVLALGDRARATILHAAWEVDDLNDASIVLRVDLGRASILFTGDATAGKRAAPADEPLPGSVEDRLLHRHLRALDVDVLQVGHHGSRTSSRRRFLQAVTPRWAIVSSGPQLYGSVTLPDADVIQELERSGATVLRTDAHDEACGTRPAKVGPPADGKPGGCDGFTLRIDSGGTVTLEPPPAEVAGPKAP